VVIAAHATSALALFLEDVSLTPDGNAFVEIRDWLLNRSESNANLTPSRVVSTKKISLTLRFNKKKACIH
jgi:hypothetical protein